MAAATLSALPARARSGLCHSAELLAAGAAPAAEPGALEAQRKQERHTQGHGQYTGSAERARRPGLQPGLELTAPVCGCAPVAHYCNAGGGWKPGGPTTYANTRL
jgi:hypothetical protein